MNHSWGNHCFSRSGTDQANLTWRNCHQYPEPARKDIYYNINHYQQHGGRSSTQSTAEWNKPGSSSQTWQSSGPEAEDLNELPYEPDNKDPKLMKKQAILEALSHLKCSMSRLPNADDSLKSPQHLNPVKHSERKLSIQSSSRIVNVEHTKSVAKSRRRALNVQNDDPLKWSVEADLQQRFDAPPVQPPKWKPVPPLSSSALHQTQLPAENEVQKSDQGFMRFLNVLNKGVDINKLMEIVKDDTDGPHSSQNSVQTHSSTNSFESPPLEKKTLAAKEQCSNTEEQQKNLQNILESLGLKFGTDEISRLGERTRERLYGTKQKTVEERQTDQQQTERKKYSPGQHTRSSSENDYNSPRRNESWRPEAHTDSHPEYPPPIQPYPYPPPPTSFDPHYPPAYSYSQHITYHNHFPSTNIPLDPPPQQFDPFETGNMNAPPNEWRDGSDNFLPPELQGLSNNNSGPCLIPLKEMSEPVTAEPVTAKPVTTKLYNFDMLQKSIFFYIKMSKTSEDPAEKQHWIGLLNSVLDSVKLPKREKTFLRSLLKCNKQPPKLSKRQKRTRNKRKRKEEMRRRLMEEAEQQVAPVKELEEPEPEPCRAPIEEEVKANLKKKLEGFINRMKNNVSQSPVNIEGKDN